MRERVGPGGLVILPSPFFYAHRVRLGGLDANEPPTGDVFRREFAEAGGLMSYGPNFKELYRRAAYYVDRILKGAKPARPLPVERPLQFELVTQPQDSLKPSPDQSPRAPLRSG